MSIPWESVNWHPHLTGAAALVLGVTEFLCQQANFPGVFGEEIYQVLGALHSAVC